MDFSTKPALPELRVRKIMGRTFLNENRLEEALETFSSILRDYPEDAESLVTLGNLYLAGGDGITAQKLFRQALELDPGNKNSIIRQIELAQTEIVEPEGEAIPTDPKAVARLLQRLTGKTNAVAEDDMWKAAELLETIIHSENPADQVAERLDEITEVLPALIEINIRQASSDGNPQVESGLRNLQKHILIQLEARESRPEPDHKEPQPVPVVYHADWKILFLRPAQSAASRRSHLIETILESLGCQVIEDNGLNTLDRERPDLVLACNPHLQAGLAEKIAACSARGIPVLVDLDTNFEELPIFHPDYAAKGLSNPARGRAYTAALMLASLITVPGEEHAAALRAAGHPAVVIPDGWSQDNLLWTKERPTRPTVNIGWANLPGQMEDLAAIRRAVMRVLREYQNTQLVVIGDLQAYRLFENLPEDRKIFLPASGPDEYPYLLGQVDVLLVPLHNHPFNNTIPESALVEAGARSIPWIGTPVPSFVRWQAGGVLANSLDDWHLQLRQLVSEADLRASLGAEGHQAACAREQAVLTRSWFKALRQLIGDAAAVAQPVSLPNQLPLEISR